MSNGRFSISVAQGRVAHEHDDRDYTPQNADWCLKNRNFTIKKTDDYQSVFNDLFRDSLAEYNAKQKREDRKKSYDYYSEIENGKGPEKAIYEYVFQIGNRENLGVTDNDFEDEKWYVLKRNGKFKEASDYVKKHLNKDPQREELKRILTEEMKKLASKYPKFRFFTIVGHDDEPCGTFHFHVAFTPVADGYKNGMSTRDSLSKALKQMGFETDQYMLGIQKWQNDVKANIETAMAEAGYEREYKNNVEAHLTVPQYKLKAQNEKLVSTNANLTDEIELNKNHLEALKAANNDYIIKYKKLQEKEKEINLKTSELDNTLKQSKNMLIELQNIKKSMQLNPPIDLIDFAKKFTKRVPIKKYNPITQKFVDYQRDDNGKVITEEHNCYDDWITHKKTRENILKRVSQLTDSVNMTCNDLSIEDDFLF